ncbi:hypothetical protein HELRODRAFT_163926, partial [Helobdella robusta]|uniref:Uncharacterized protein n=1 Tax=Helobdella robusta TaxID=6412 RepID=T1EUM5_HELRO
DVKLTSKKFNTIHQQHPNKQQQQPHQLHANMHLGQHNIANNYHNHQQQQQPQQLHHTTLQLPTHYTNMIASFPAACDYPYDPNQLLNILTLSRNMGLSRNIENYYASTIKQLVNNNNNNINNNNNNNNFNNNKTINNNILNPLVNNFGNGKLNKRPPTKPDKTRLKSFFMSDILQPDGLDDNNDKFVDSWVDESNCNKHQSSNNNQLHAINNIENIYNANKIHVNTSNNTNNNNTNNNTNNTNSPTIANVDNHKLSIVSNPFKNNSLEAKNIDECDENDGDGDEDDDDEVMVDNPKTTPNNSIGRNSFFSKNLNNLPEA